MNHIEKLDPVQVQPVKCCQNRLLSTNKEKRLLASYWLNVHVFIVTRKLKPTHNNKYTTFNNAQLSRSPQEFAKKSNFTRIFFSQTRNVNNFRLFVVLLMPLPIQICISDHIMQVQPFGSQQAFEFFVVEIIEYFAMKCTRSVKFLSIKLF